MSASLELLTEEQAREARSVPDLDYMAGLDEGDVLRLNDLSFDTRGLIRYVVSGIVKIGLNLIQAKEILHSDGKFHAWLHTEFGWSIRSAQNMMSVGRMFPYAVERTWDIDIRALYVLASGSLPDEVRDFFIEKADAGLHISYLDVRTRTSIDGTSICNVCAMRFEDADQRFHCPNCNDHVKLEDLEVNGNYCPSCGEPTAESVFAPMDDIEPIVLDLAEAAARPEVPQEEKAARMLANMLWITNLEPELVVEYLDDIQRETVTDLVRWMGSFGKALKSSR